MSRPLQDINTCALFMFLVILIAAGVVQVRNILEVPAKAQFDSSPAMTFPVDSMDNLDEEMLATEEATVKDCEVVYHRASQGNVYLDGYPYLVSDRSKFTATIIQPASDDEEHDDMGDLYYALYTCSGAAVIAEGYI